MVGSRLHAIRTALTVRELGRLAAMFGFILAVNVAGWAIFVLYVMARWSSNVAAQTGATGLARPCEPVGKP